MFLLVDGVFTVSSVFIVFTLAKKSTLHNFIITSRSVHPGPLNRTTFLPLSRPIEGGASPITSALERIKVGVQIYAFIGQAQLVSCHTAMLFNSVKGNVEQAGDFFIGHAVFDEVADFYLTGSQFYTGFGYFYAEGGGQVFEGLAVLLKILFFPVIEPDFLQ